MKKLFTVIAVLVTLLLIAPWGVGMLAQRHVNRGIDRLLEEAPYLSIVERKYNSGWFRSEQEVTFEVLSDWTPAINSVIEVANAQSAAKANEVATQAAIEAASSGEVLENTNSGPAVAAEETPVPEFKPPRFTVRNEVLHGPVLWPFSLGAAHVNTNVVWGAKLRHEFIEVFGDDKPFRVSTRIGFLGSGTTTISGDARTLKPDESEQVSWDKFEFKVDFSGDGDHMRVNGGWPRLEFKSADGVQFVMLGLRANGSAKRILGELYDTDAVFELESLRMAASNGKTVEAADVKYIVDTQNHDDFVDFTFKFGTGPIKVADFALQESHYDFSLRRLHSASFEKLLVAMRETYSKSAQSLRAVEHDQVETYRKHGFTLLTHDPEFVIDRINLVTKSGDGTIKGSFRFKGVTETDLEMGGLGLVAKLEAELDFDVAESLITELGGQPEVVATAVDAGYAKRREGRVVSKIEFRAGNLKINGKSQGIPGVGGPQPGMGPEAMAEEMPPE